MPDDSSRLIEALHAACESERFAWLEQARARLANSEDTENDLANLSAMARRKAGDGQLACGLAKLDTAAGELDISDWPIADAARVSLLLAAIQTAPDRTRQLVEFLFGHGDEAERAAIARGIALLDPRAELKALLLEAGRANSLLLVSAVSLRNPYPAAFYSQHEFNQLVLKALFLELPVDQIVGLQRRANAELSRMCEDYYDERSEAQRTVPVDIWLALGPFASARGEALLLDHLSHDSPAHRCYAATAIGQRLPDHPQLRDALMHRKTTETDPRVLNALHTALKD